MNPKLLYKQTGPTTYEPTSAWYCGKCGTVHRSEDLAQLCCVCPSCAGPAERSAGTCEACWKARAVEREKLRWEKAETVLEADWNGEGMLEWNDQYFDWVDELEEYLYENGMESMPDEVWIAPGRPIIQLPDASRLVESWETEPYEDWEWDGEGEEELNEAIKRFNLVNDRPQNRAYSPDYRRKLVIDPQRVQAFRRAWEGENADDVRTLNYKDSDGYDHDCVRCELMADVDADTKYVGEPGTCCVCVGHDCEDALKEREKHPAKNTTIKTTNN